MVHFIFLVACSLLEMNYFVNISLHKLLLLFIIIIITIVTTS